MFLAGFLAVLAGTAIFILMAIRFALKSPPGRGGALGVIFIGPFPIVFVSRRRRSSGRQA